MMREAIAHIDSSKPLFCDSETCEQFGYSVGGLYGDVRLFQAYQKGWDYCLIFDIFFLNEQEFYKLIKPFHHVYHNASYDLHTINCHTPTTWLPSRVDDTLYLAKLHFPQEEKFDYYACLSHAGLEDDVIRNIDKHANQKAAWGKVLTPQMLGYAACDVTYLADLYEQVKEQVDTEVYNLDIDNLRYSIHYDRTGIPINLKRIYLKRKETLKEYERLSKDIPVNINSPPQCKEWLNTTATDSASLNALAIDGDKRAENLVWARKMDKQLMFLNKYGDETIRGFHNACGSKTGRMTCDGGGRIFYENLQQIPRAVLDCIEARGNDVIVYKDYSGLELRMAVAYVGEPTMERLMKDGIDVHTETGCDMYNTTPDKITFKERFVGKFYNFGTVYGAGKKVLQSSIMIKGNIGMSLGEIERLRQKWLNKYTYFREWHAMHRKHFNIYGFLDTRTELGRNMRAVRFNDSFNYPVQGSSSEVVKLAVHYLYTRYNEDPNVIAVIHDSIAMIHPEGDVAEMWKERLNECMVDSWFYVIKDTAIPDLPMPPEAKINKNWDF